MSAVSIPRAFVPAVADPPWIDPLDPLWEDPHLDPIVKLFCLQMRRWRELHPGWWPTHKQMGAWVGRSAQSAERYLQDLAQAGYVVIRPDGYDLTTPAPRFARILPRAGQCQGELFPSTAPDPYSMGGTEPPHPWNGTPPSVERGPVVGSGSSPPHTPPGIVFGFSEGSKKTTTDVVGEKRSSSSLEKSPEEIPQELTTRALEVIPDASPEWIRGLVMACGAHGFALALLVIEWVAFRMRHPNRDIRPKNRRRYATTAALEWAAKLDREVMTLDDVRAEIAASPRCAAPTPPVTVRASAEPEPEPEPEAPPELMSADQVAELVLAAWSTAFGRLALRTALENGSIAPELAATIPADLLKVGAGNTPAAGSSAKTSPRPAGETTGRPSPGPRDSNAPRRTRTYNPLIKSACVEVFHGQGFTLPNSAEPADTLSAGLDIGATQVAQVAHESYVSTVDCHHHSAPQSVETDRCPP